MFDIDEPVYFSAPDGARYRITIRYDDVAESPRDWDNVTTMHTFDSRWNSPDGERCQDRRHHAVHPIIPGEYVEPNTVGGPVDIRRARKWVALFDEDILMIGGLHRGHEGTLSLSLDADESDGYIVITADRWETMMGGTVFTEAQGQEFMQQDIDVYNKWASGEFTSYLVEREMNWQALDSDGGVVEDRTMTTWEDTESIGGFDDGDEAFRQAVETLPEGSDRED